jgi:hypothetical protein
VLADSGAVAVFVEDAEQLDKVLRRADAGGCGRSWCST